MVQNSINSFRNRHVDTEPPGQPGDFTRGTHAFGDMTEFGKNLWQLFPAASASPT